MTHTPGPWKLQPADRRKHHVDVCGVDLCVCTIPDDDDAILIAAAPEMLSALRETEVVYRELCLGQSLENECWSILWRIQAAISKAEGK